MARNKPVTSKQGSRPVRFFFDLVVFHDSPSENLMHGETKNAPSLLKSSSRQIGGDLTNFLEQQMTAIFAGTDFQIASEKKRDLPSIDSRKHLTAVPYLISTLHDFNSDEIIKHSSSEEFEIKEQVFAATTIKFKNDIVEILEKNSLIHEIQFLHAVSRVFIFDIYHEGNFRLKREFSQKELKSDNICELLSSFFDEVLSAAEQIGLEVSEMPSTSQRNRNNEYEFKYYYNMSSSFDEKEVCGEGVYGLREFDDLQKLNDSCVSFKNYELSDFTDKIRYVLEDHLPPETTLVNFNLFYIDDSDEIVEIYNELHINKNESIEGIMTSKPETELKFMVSGDPLPTVEIDMDNIPANYDGYTDLVAYAISAAAEYYPKKRATFYTYFSPSMNFFEQTRSVFIGIAGDEKILDILLEEIRSAGVTNSRHSDYIDILSSSREFHMQEGAAWFITETGNWVRFEEHQSEVIEEEDNVWDELADAEDNLSGDTGDTSEIDELESKNSRLSLPSRYRAARSDAKVGTIRRTIEEIFGLPEGSVALCGPNKQALRADATIGTLRRRWDNK